MKPWFAELAVALVRIWARIYTTGMRTEIRERRRAEIESDLWESLHDAESARRSSVHIVIRLARGIPADVFWRVEHAAIGGQSMWRKLCFVALAGATLLAILWSFSPLSEPPSIPPTPGPPAPSYLVKRRVPPPPPPPPPTWEEFVAKMKGREPQKPVVDTTSKR
jgi:hypothetical protein